MTKRNGFTLIEIMVVIVILGVLAAVGIPKLFGMKAKAKAAEVPTAAGTYIHLQEVYLHNNHDIGSWRDIGYSAPGNGKTTSFVYNDCIQEKIPLQNNTESVAGWKASNTAKLNECVPNNSWIVIIDPQGESEVHYREVVSSADCASLTSSWTVEEVSTSNCTH
ncbi:MAG: type II secretion system protein [Fibrobacter sp.]|nr:type II secretion system protein [Fibrobacter sp.]